MTAQPRTPTRYPDPALEAGLAYRHEQLRAAASRGPTRRNPWYGRHRRSSEA